MKNLIIIFFLTFPIYAQHRALPVCNYVADEVGIFSTEEIAEIEKDLKRAESIKGVRIGIVIIDSLGNYSDAQNIEITAKKILRNSLPNGSSILMLFAMEDRKVRIQLGKGYYSFGEANRINQEIIIPKFKAGDYKAGIREGMNEVISEYAGHRVFNLRNFIIFFSAVWVLSIFSLYRNGKNSWGWIVVGIHLILVLGIFRIFIWIITTGDSNYDNDDDDWDYDHRDRRNNFFSFGSSSSRGGFSGGSSGGGGATGSW